MISKPFLVFAASVFSITLNAQSYIGHSVDNYAGIHGVIYNPASIVSSNLRAEINLVSASGLVGNDYFGVSIGDLIDAPDEFDYDGEINESPSDNNNFFLNADIVGPSFMFNLNKKSSIGIVTRVRGIFNVNDINGALYKNVLDGFDTNENFDFDSPNLTGTIHSWAEIGMSYGRILMNKQRHLITGGVTLKYLLGAGSLFVNTQGLRGQYDATNETLQSQGFLNYGNTQGFENDNIDYTDLTSGFGLDLGFIYEFHPNRDNDEIRYFQDPYKLKLGLSITDIGSINYDSATITSYNMNAMVSTVSFEDELEEFLDNNYENTATGQGAKIQLPTAMHILLDYRLANKLLVSAQADLSLTNRNEALSNRMMNSLTVTPRIETKWFSFYLPLSYRQYGDFVFGGGFRLGPLSVGSGSVFSNLISESSQTADVFVGLKIPLYRK